MQPFQPLDAFLWPPPVPALLSVALALALLGLGDLLAVALRGRDLTRPLDSAAGFVLAVGLLSAATYVLALLGFAWRPLLQSLAALVLVGGAWGLRRWYARCWGTGVAALKRQWHATTIAGRWVLACASLVVGGLGLAALGPATEVDSLDYHLGVPLDWLRHGEAQARSDWMHAPFVGVGDAANLLGLALGTDSLGSALQLAGLLVALAAALACADDPRNRALVIALVVGCVAWITLVPSQKPFVLPAAASTVAVVLLVRRSADIDLGTQCLAFGSAAFAVGCKYSFLFSGVVLFGLGLLAARRNGAFQRGAAVAAAALVLLALPTYAGNFWLYGDPLWPFLQGFAAAPDPVAAGFSWHVRQFGSASRSLTGFARLGLETVLPLDPARLGNALGLGCVAGVLAWRDRRASRTLLVAAASVVGLVLVFGQLTPRFFLEPYLWCAAAVGATSWRWPQRMLLAGMGLQLTGLAAIAVYAAVALFPGACTAAWREQVMHARAPGHAVCRWMDTTLPRDAVVASTVRAHALYPRPYLAADFARFLDRTRLDEAEKRRRLLDASKQRGVTVVVARLPLETGPYASIASDLDAPLGPAVTFVEATRNPLGRGTRFTMQAFGIRPVEATGGTAGGESTLGGLGHDQRARRLDVTFQRPATEPGRLQLAVGEQTPALVDVVR